MGPKTKLYLWNWVGGGYNSCRARDRSHALKLGNAMAKNLTVSEPTLRECTVDELNAEEKRWGPYD